MTISELQAFLSKYTKKSLENGIVAIVGAGASVASGLSTFRGEGGMYTTGDAAELATPHAFRERPYDVWAWYNSRMAKVFDTTPSGVHKSLVILENMGMINTVVTQNVDGLHRLAGQKKLIEIHGTMLSTHCFDNCGAEFEISSIPENIPVSCSCGSLQRPSVVWFGESLDFSNLERVEGALSSCSLIITIGTSGTVFPVAQFPAVAKYQGAALIDFNVEMTPISQLADIFVEGPAEDTLPIMVEILQQLSEE